MAVRVEGLTRHSVGVQTLRLYNRIVIDGVSADVANQIRTEFTYSNPEHAKAQAMGLFVRVPRYLTSWVDGKDGTLSVPRGGLSRVVKIVADEGDYQIVDATVTGRPVEIPTSKVTPYDYQTRLIDAALAKFNVGYDTVALWRSVQASGKTTAALILATRMRVKTMVIISNSVLMRQWMTRIRKELGIEPGVIGGGRRNLEPPIVVAMQQSLKNVTDAELAQFGLVIGDEIQLFAATTFQESIDRFPARCRLGVSGDEHRADRKEFLIYDQFGGVTAEVKADELVSAGRIHEVEVRVVPTEFRADWYTDIATMRARPGEPQEKLQMRKARAKIMQAERLSTEMAEDAARTKLVVDLATSSVRDYGRVLILATRREHCHRIETAVSAVGLSSGLLIGGSDYRKEFERTLAGFEDRRIQVAIGTYQAIGVGFDLPSIDCGICAAPVANAASGDKQWRQYRGRFARTATGKTDAVLYYLWDGYVFADKPLRHLRRWNSRVTVADADGITPVEQWIEVHYGTKTQRRDKSKPKYEPRQRSIPGFDTEPQRPVRTRSGAVVTKAVGGGGTATGNGRESGMGVPVPRRRRSEAGRSG